MLGGWRLAEFRAATLQKQYYRGASSALPSLPLPVSVPKITSEHNDGAGLDKMGMAMIFQDRRAARPMGVFAQG